MTKDDHQHPDRVRLPKSLFGSLKSSGPMLRLGIIILDVGPGNVFKVRRDTGWLRFNTGFTGTRLPPLESLLMDPMGTKEVMNVCRMFLKQPRSSRPLSLESGPQAHAGYSHLVFRLHPPPTNRCPWACICIPSEFMSSVHPCACTNVHPFSYS